MRKLALGSTRRGRRNEQTILDCLRAAPPGGQFCCAALRFRRHLSRQDRFAVEHGYVNGDPTLSQGSSNSGRNLSVCPVRVQLDAWLSSVVQRNTSTTLKRMFCHAAPERRDEGCKYRQSTTDVNQSILLAGLLNSQQLSATSVPKGASSSRRIEDDFATLVCGARAHRGHPHVKGSAALSSHGPDHGSATIASKDLPSLGSENLRATSAVASMAAEAKA